MLQPRICNLRVRHIQCRQSRQSRKICQASVVNRRSVCKKSLEGADPRDVSHSGGRDFLVPPDLKGEKTWQVLNHPQLRIRGSRACETTRRQMSKTGNVCKD